nr:uncharacterized protein CTRU02_13147 [Colletotrichum truncatum]KAF6783639.1 hypothetical protein CTRU02_13147 [Colletotrichum truncatum]
MQSRSSSSRASSSNHSSPRNTSSNVASPRYSDLNLVGLEPLPCKITDAFFLFVGDLSSPITDVFTLSFMKTYLKSSIPIRAIVTTIGNILLEYERQSDLSSWQAAAAALAAQDRPRLNGYLDMLTSPEYEDQHLTLLFGNLLAYMELMVARSWCLFEAVLNKLSDKIRGQLGEERRTPFLYFDRGLLMNFSLLKAYSALILRQDTFLAGSDLYDPSPFVDIDSSISQVRANAAILHHYCKWVAYFARCHHKATRFVRESRHTAASLQNKIGDVTKEELRHALSEAGLLKVAEEIIESSYKITTVLDVLRASDEDDEALEGGDFSYLRDVYYRFAHMALTRTFSDPIWKLIGEDVPAILDLPDLETYGLAILERFERRAPVAGLESWSYLPILMGVAFEVKKPEDQKRVENLVMSIAEKGFASAESMLGDMRLLWKMGSAFKNSMGIGL